RPTVFPRATARPRDVSSETRHGTLESALLLEPQADAVLSRAVVELQILEPLLLHREVEQARDRLVRLFLRQHLAIENALERRILAARLPDAAFHAARIHAAAADSRAAHANRSAHAPAARRLRALAARTLRPGDGQPAPARDLAGRHRLGAVAVFIRAQHEVVA